MLPSKTGSLLLTVWEIKQRNLIDMAADRGAFICQSQSLNLFMEEPTVSKLTSMHFYAWKKGLKTGLYYLRTQSAARAVQFTIERQDVREGSRQEINVDRIEHSGSQDQLPI